MPDKQFDLTLQDDVLRLGEELRSFGFLVGDGVDTILEVLSDIEWFTHGPPGWEPGISYGGRGFHPVSGPDGDWDVYMFRATTLVWLIAPSDFSVSVGSDPQGLP